MSNEKKDAIMLQLGDKFYVLPKADADKYLVDQSTFAKYSESSDVEGQAMYTKTHPYKKAYS